MTRFDYKIASAEDIADYFEVCNRASIWNARNRYKNDPVMSEKIESAYKLYKTKHNRKLIEQ